MLEKKEQVGRRVCLSGGPRRSIKALLICPQVTSHASWMANSHRSSHGRGLGIGPVPEISSHNVFEQSWKTVIKVNIYLVQLEVPGVGSLLWDVQWVGTQCLALTCSVDVSRICLLLITCHPLSVYRTWSLAVLSICWAHAAFVGGWEFSSLIRMGPMNRLQMHFSQFRLNAGNGGGLLQP